MTPRLASALMPLMRNLDAETAHGLALRALRAGLAGSDRGADDPVLATTAFGLRFRNPIGLAAGFDKNAEVPDALLRLGFGFVEIGTVTPRPQAGNPRPRLFRLAEDRGVINRMGFNNDGLEACRAPARRAAAAARAASSASISAPTRTARTASRDYVALHRGAGAARRLPRGQRLLAQHAGPARPAGRAAQLADLLDARRRTPCAPGRPPLLVKIAPDLADDDARRHRARPALTHGVDGIIVSNTTIARPPTLRSRACAARPAACPGAPLFGAVDRGAAPASHRLARGQFALVGVGGVGSGADAYAKIRAGASAGAALFRFRL